MVMTRDQNAGQSHNTKISNGSFEKVELFKCLGTNLTYQSTIQKKLNRLKQGMQCRGAESFVFQFAIQKFKYYDIHKYNSAVVLYGCEIWSFTLRAEG